MVQQHQQRHHHCRRTHPRTRRTGVVVRAVPVASVDVDRRRTLDPVRHRLVRTCSIPRLASVTEEADSTLRFASLHFDARALYKIHRVTPRVDVLDDKEATVVVVVVIVEDDEDDDADECCRRNIVIINCENNPGNHDVRMELRIDGVR